MKPAAVVGTAGTTGTGSIDPLDELADIATRVGAWFHVDAAYGGAVVLSDELRPLLNGIERADSITFDTHKWLYAPLVSAALLVRDAAATIPLAAACAWTAARRNAVSLPYPPELRDGQPVAIWY